MRILRWSILLIAVFLANYSFAGIRPSFSLDYSAWHATHIALVVTTTKDGVFQVIESWRGELPVGQYIAIPELRPDRNSVSISQYSKSWPYHGDTSEQVPREPVDSRMILFLKGDTAEQSGAHAPNSDRVNGWKPSDLLGSMKASGLARCGHGLLFYAADQSRTDSFEPSGVFRSRHPKARRRDQRCTPRHRNNSHDRRW